LLEELRQEEIVYQEQSLVVAKHGEHRLGVLRRERRLFDGWSWGWGGDGNSGNNHPFPFSFSCLTFLYDVLLWNLLLSISFLITYLKSQWAANIPTTSSTSFHLLTGTQASYNISFLSPMS
jgi:hypothetical protein